MNCIDIAIYLMKLYEINSKKILNSIMKSFILILIISSYIRYGTLCIKSLKKRISENEYSLSDLK